MCFSLFTQFGGFFSGICFRFVEHKVQMLLLHVWLWFWRITFQERPFGFSWSPAAMETSLLSPVLCRFSSGIFCAFISIQPLRRSGRFSSAPPKQTVPTLWCRRHHVSLWGWCVHVCFLPHSVVDVIKRKIKKKKLQFYIKYLNKNIFKYWFIFSKETKKSLKIRGAALYMISIY